MQVREHVDDNALSRSLQRLTRFGLVQADSKRHGSRSINIYTLTDNGREHMRPSPPSTRTCTCLATNATGVAPSTVDRATGALHDAH